MATTTRNSRIYTISLPPDLALKAESLAKRDSRSMSELFREAFRSYYSQDSQNQSARQALEEIQCYAATRNPNHYTESDIPHLIREVRASDSATPLATKKLSRKARKPR